MSYELPEHTCPDIDRVKHLIKGKLGDDEHEANELLEVLRENNRLLRNAAEYATDRAEKAEARDYDAGEHFQGRAAFYCN